MVEIARDTTWVKMKETLLHSEAGYIYAAQYIWG